MDESPEEMEEIRREAASIDTNKYRRRQRLIWYSLASLFSLTVVWVTVTLAQAARNPCEQVRDYYCSQAPDKTKCGSYTSIWQESVVDESPKMRSTIRDQCLTKIERLKEEEGITLK